MAMEFRHRNGAKQVDAHVVFTLKGVLVHSTREGGMNVVLLTNLEEGLKGGITVYKYAPNKHLQEKKSLCVNAIKHFRRHYMFTTILKFKILSKIQDSRRKLIWAFAMQL